MDVAAARGGDVGTVVRRNLRADLEPLGRVLVRAPPPVPEARAPEAPQRGPPGACSTWAAERRRTRGISPTNSSSSAWSHRAFAAQQARAATRASVHVGDLAAAAYPAGFFDAVTAFDVDRASPRSARDAPGGAAHLATRRSAGDRDGRHRQPECAIGRGPLVLRAAARPPVLLLAPHAGRSPHERRLRRRREPAHSSRPARLELPGRILPSFGAAFAAPGRRFADSRAPIFRSRSPYYRVPYFFDHMLASAEARA